MKKIRAIWELMRLEHGVMIAIAILIGSLIALKGEGLQSFEKFILTFFTALFLEASTFALNDYCDLDIDKKNKRKDRPLVRGDLSPKSALYLFYIFFPLGIICSYFVNTTCFIIALITALLAILYISQIKSNNVFSIGSWMFMYSGSLSKDLEGDIRIFETYDEVIEGGDPALNISSLLSPILVVSLLVEKYSKSYIKGGNLNFYKAKKLIEKE